MLWCAGEGGRQRDWGEKEEGQRGRTSHSGAFEGDRARVGVMEEAGLLGNEVRAVGTGRSMEDVRVVLNVAAESVEGGGRRGRRGPLVEVRSKQRVRSASSTERVVINFCTIPVRALPFSIAQSHETRQVRLSSAKRASQPLQEIHQPRPSCGLLLTFLLGFKHLGKP
jgi:hypothetical protein